METTDPFPVMPSAQTSWTFMSRPFPRFSNYNQRKLIDCTLTKRFLIISLTKYHIWLQPGSLRLKIVGLRLTRWLPKPLFACASKTLRFIRLLTTCCWAHRIFIERKKKYWRKEWMDWMKMEKRTSGSVKSNLWWSLLISTDLLATLLCLKW